MPRYSLNAFGRKIPLADTSEPLSKQVGRRLQGQPDTKIDSGGSVNSFTFDGQEISSSELREIREIRESGGVISALMRSKALLTFGRPRRTGTKTYLHRMNSCISHSTNLQHGTRPGLVQFLEAGKRLNNSVQISKRLRAQSNSTASHKDTSRWGEREAHRFEITNSGACGISLTVRPWILIRSS